MDGPQLGGICGICICGYLYLLASVFVEFVAVGTKRCSVWQNVILHIENSLLYLCDCALDIRVLLAHICSICIQEIVQR